MEISPDEKSLIAVTSSGDALLFSLPSLRLLRSLFAYEDARAPIQVAWLSNEVCARHIFEFFYAPTLCS